MRRFEEHTHVKRSLTGVKSPHHTANTTQHFLVNNVFLIRYRHHAIKNAKAFINHMGATHEQLDIVLHCLISGLDIRHLGVGIAREGTGGHMVKRLGKLQRGAINKVGKGGTGDECPGAHVGGICGSPVDNGNTGLHKLRKDNARKEFGILGDKSANVTDGRAHSCHRSGEHGNRLVGTGVGYDGVG